MNKLIATLILAVGCLFAAGAATPTREEAARAAADEWLALVDAGKYPESRDKMSADFKSEVSNRKWKSTITEIRKPLGKLVSRKLKSAEYTKELPGAPEGEYVVVQFDASFEQKKSVTEKVTLLLGQDLIWRVSGYAAK